MTRISRSGSADALPLALYVHTPWCVSKCPYCDFNSHAADQPPFERYVSHLLADLDREVGSAVARRALRSVYIGGGTPSLFPEPAIRRLLDGIRARADLASDVEITMEANPGKSEWRRLAAYREAGVNRLSIGAQSLSTVRLRALGRAHAADDVRRTVQEAREAGFTNVNLDMMYALPDQSLGEAERDLAALIDLGPEHISYYQLTLEPNTGWRVHPPHLPDSDLAADMAEQGLEQLGRAGYRQYEVSAYARDGLRCRHNLNYWEFGDYLGIGAGAHGKLTSEAGATGDRRRVRRTAKRHQPRAYLSASPAELTSSVRDLDEDDLVVEFALNAFRLTEGFDRGLFSLTTGMPWARISTELGRAELDGMVRVLPDRVEPTALGRRFVNELVGRFVAGG